ncbi:PH domain-containing protein [Bacillus sp. H-16]|uniref:PH domain-containing protein n=1 Tax=Alteribacter salitolerans TaxID=2912333 RepID=UPI00196304CC|nr:PH domain-containing protein [Alteribacter salitolerans]MBM7094589.1 PH domain-containing protein [Alteribacter salitolerans]
MSDFKRQHPISIFVSFFGNLKQMIITLIVLFFFGSSQTRGPWFYFLVLGALLVFSFLSGFLHWLTFRYRLDEQELHIRQGLIFRKKRYIHQDRVQSIDLNAKLIQRMFNLVEVRIETAGGGDEPEFRIIALNKEEANDIRNELLYGKKKRETEAPDSDGNSILSEEEIDQETVSKEPDYTWKLSTKRLITAALTSSGIGVAATFVAALFSQVQQFIPETWYETAIGFVVESSVLFILSFLILVLVIAWLIRIVSTVLKYGNFSIEKTGNDIVIARGLLERRQLTLNRRRITAVRLVQNVLRQPFGYTSVYVESAGGGTKDEDLSTILIPLCKETEVKAHLEKIVPDFAFERPLTGLPKKSMKRYMVRLTVPAVIAASAITYFFDYGAYSFAAIIVALLMGYWQYKDAGIGVNERFLWMRMRKFARTTVIVPKKRIQTVEVTSNPLQRLNQLTTLEVSILTSIMGKTFSLRHLSEQQSMNYYMWYSYEHSTKYNEETKS